MFCCLHNGTGLVFIHVSPSFVGDKTCINHAETWALTHNERLAQLFNGHVVVYRWELEFENPRRLFLPENLMHFMDDDGDRPAESHKKMFWWHSQNDTPHITGITHFQITTNLSWIFFSIGLTNILVCGVWNFEKIDSDETLKRYHYHWRKQ